MYLELDKIKKHLNIDADFTDDDEYIMFLAQVAEDMVQKHIDNDFSEIIAEEGALPNALLHAMLLYIGNMYANRESISYSATYEIPQTLSYILQAYRSYSNANI